MKHFRLGTPVKSSLVERGKRKENSFSGNKIHVTNILFPVPMVMPTISSSKSHQSKEKLLFHCQVGQLVPFLEKKNIYIYIYAERGAFKKPSSLCYHNCARARG